MQLNLPMEQALGLAECIDTHAHITGHDLAGRVLITVGDGGLTAAPLIVAFTRDDTNLATFEVNVAGTIEAI